MTLLPALGKVKEHGLASHGSAALHCFERKMDLKPSEQTTNKNDDPSLNKRRKLKSGKAKSLGDMLEGLT